MLEITAFGTVANLEEIKKGQIGIYCWEELGGRPNLEVWQKCESELKKNRG